MVRKSGASQPDNDCNSSWNVSFEGQVAHCEREFAGLIAITVKMASKIHKLRRLIRDAELAAGIAATRKAKPVRRVAKRAAKP